MATEDRGKERRITTDRDTIRDWAERHDARPVRFTSGATEGRADLGLVPGDELGSEHEEITWDEFHEEVDRGDMVVVYHDDGEFDVLERDEATARATIESEEVESALLEGETVTTRITERRVIEREVVETETIESEVVDREVVRSKPVDAEVLTREITDARFVGEPAEGETMSESTTGEETAVEYEMAADVEDVEVLVDVEESRMETEEILERIVVESRVVDSDVTVTDTVESEEVEGTVVDLEGVERTILDSDLVESEDVAGEMRESDVVGSVLVDEGTIRTQFYELRVVESEVVEDLELLCGVERADVLSTTTAHSETVESELVDEEYLAGEDVETIALEEVTTGAETATATDEEVVGAEGATAATVGEDAEAAAADTDVLTEADVGMDVVDETGEEIGMVAEVEADTVYVDPHPSITDRIRAALDWGGRDEDAYPVDRAKIRRVTDDEVQLRSIDEL